MRRIKFSNILFNIFTLITIALATFIVVLLATHTRAFSVSTGSMNPTLKTGDIIFVKPVEFDSVQKKDIVTIEYNDSSGYFTHRVVRVDKENGLIYTKGDANEKQDPIPSSSKKLVGKMWFRIPILGQLSLHITKNTILIIIASVAAAALVGSFTALTIKKSKKRGGSYEK
ncbi:MAG: signal peptidase I [Clostridiales bacterium]|nr:signal peptidase I [Clostridiales bacterium]